MTVNNELVGWLANIEGCDYDFGDPVGTPHYVVFDADGNKLEHGYI